MFSEMHHFIRVHIRLHGGSKQYRVDEMHCFGTNQNGAFWLRGGFYFSSPPLRQTIVNLGIFGLAQSPPTPDFTHLRCSPHRPPVHPPKPTNPPTSVTPTNDTHPQNPLECNIPDSLASTKTHKQAHQLEVFSCILFCWFC
jgi:hypothetical protein